MASLLRQLVIDMATGVRADSMNRFYERHVRREPGARIRVLFFHATPVTFADQFRRQLDWLQQRYDVIDFAAFKRRMDRADPGSDRPAVLLTFDDGFVSNYRVAAPLLEARGLRGVFFVVPAFSLATPDESRAFFLEHLHGRPERCERAMTPDEILDLAERGHTIGNHTFSHTRLSVTPEAEYRHEILDAAALIESWIGRSVEAFAWTYRWDAITPAAYRLAAGRHRYCFSPCAGVVDPHADDTSLLWRAGAEVDRSFREFRFQCSGLADHLAARRRHALRGLARGSGPARDYAARAMRNSRARA